MFRFVLALVVLVMATPAFAADSITKGPTPTWVETVTADPASDQGAVGEAFRVLLLDQQYRADDEGGHAYARYRTIIRSPQGLRTAGAVGIVWSPASQTPVVHHISIIRDGATIDVLASQEFEILRREQNLESAMLDGLLTATLQPAGLRVGDILDVAYSITTRDPVLGAHAEYFAAAAAPLTADRMRVSASWPADRPVRVRATDGWTLSPVRTRAGSHRVEIDLRDVQAIDIPADAPRRFQDVRQFELTDYRDWSDMAAVMAPLYARAETLEADSPLAAEIARIAALSEDPGVRAAAALRLVQDDIRYLALNMGEAGLTPASADETWRRRFGDCKGKTALLLALLHGLGIEAAPAAVSTVVGDGLEQRLPLVDLFDHVLVRAVVGGRVYWLDGARIGDRILEDIQVPPYRWALPLIATGGALERLDIPAATKPMLDSRLTIDASAGLYAPATVTGEVLMRGDAAAVLGSQISSVSTAQRDQYLRAFWATQMDDLTIGSVASTYDNDLNELRLTVIATAAQDWTSARGRLPIPGTGVVTNWGEARRAGPYRDAPVQIPHPAYTIQRATVKLPRDGDGFALNGADIDRGAAGYQFSRSARLENGSAVVELTMRTLQDEVPIAEVDALRADASSLNRTKVQIIAPAGYDVTQGDRDALTAAEPTTAEGFVERAVALSAMGEMNAAREAANRAVALAPENANVVANRGIILFHSGQMDAAKADFDNAAEIDPSERIAMNGYAMVALVEGRYDDAVVELSRALRQAPADIFALTSRASAYAGLRQTDKALRDIDAAIAAQSEESSLKLMRVELLLDGGRKAEAMSEADALAALRPEDRDVRMAQARIKLDNDLPAEARTILDEAIAASDENSALLLLRAEALTRLGEDDAATADLTLVRDIGGGEAFSLNNLCWTQATRGMRLEAALKDCDAALALEPDNSGFLDSRAMVLLRMGDDEGALVVYDKVIGQAPRQAGSLYGRGLAKQALGREDEGVADIAAALRINPRAGDDYRSYEASRPLATNPPIASPSS